MEQLSIVIPCIPLQSCTAYPTIIESVLTINVSRCVFQLSCDTQLASEAFIRLRTLFASLEAFLFNFIRVQLLGGQFRILDKR